ncbi:MAG: ribosome small subunit-dependent GTPase A [Nocardioidaceae bacterium]
MAANFSLQQLGWDDSWRELAAAYDGVGEPGRIARVDRGLCTVYTRSGTVRGSIGGDVLDDWAADAMTAPTTGDWCWVRSWCDGPLTIEALLPRRTSIIRADAAGSSRGQVLAANVDVAGIVVALHPEPNLARIERLLTLAWQSGARPAVFLTKADMVNDAAQVADDVRMAAAGVEVICCSAVTGKGVDALRGLLDVSSTLALLGASGHGKSTLTNALVGADLLATKALRPDGKGRHTSVRRELLPVPSGGSIIDTPGLRGVGLQNGRIGIETAFPEIEALAGSCRFRDCTHDGEPGCAVLQGLAVGEIGVRRLDSWRKLQREVEWSATRSDVRRRAEQKRRLTQLTHRHRRGPR